MMFGQLQTPESTVAKRMAQTLLQGYAERLRARIDAGKAIGEVLPELAGRLEGSAIRVPTPNVSAVDLTFRAGRSVTVQEINAIVREAAQGDMRMVLSYDPEPKVSIDFNHTPYSSIFAPDQTRVVGRMVRVLAWYDNEWGFSCRMADVAGVMGRLLQ